MNNRIFLISPDDVKAKSQINYNVDDSTVASAIRDAQSIYLREILGDVLLEKLQDLVTDGIDNPENEAYKALLDDYVGEYLAYRANVEICLPISLKIRNIGISQDSDTNIQAAQIDTIEHIRDYYLTQACDKANRMICFLLENEPAFPELKVCSCRKGCKSPNLNKQVNTNLCI